MGLATNHFVILCVDDEPTLLRIRELVLIGHGYRVRTATGSAQAMNIFRVEKVDLVITDHLLPGQSGVEMAAEMKRIKPEVPVMLLTGSSELPDAMEGIDDYLIKGIPVPLFLEHVASLLQK